MLCNCLTVRFLHQLNCLVSRSCLPTERYFSVADASTSFPIPYRTVSRSLPFPSHRFDRVILCTIDHSHYRESRGQFRCVLLDFIPQRATDPRSTIQRWFSSSFSAVAGNDFSASSSFERATGQQPPSETQIFLSRSIKLR